ncbi:MAG: cupin-like domain-containing protein [Cellvibrionales bacterium]|jgi:hypothetical protein
MPVANLQAVDSVSDLAAPELPNWLFTRTTPLVMRGLVADWPAIPTGEGGVDELESYLSKFWNERPVTAYVTPAANGGRFGYNDGFNGFNFNSGSGSLADIMQRLREQHDPANEHPLAIYVGSTPVDGWLPGFQAANALSVPGEPLVNFWLGNRTTISAHYDFPNNIACVVYGRRRFTLFPIEQVDNLYVGPIDRTPSGQPISLVDFDNPDFERFPKFREALAHAQVAELEPGDALFVPSMWWHHVKALSDCNLLVNYWWLDSAAQNGSPFNALLHAVLTLRQLPEHQRRAWQTLMEHYVFDGEGVDHIPAHARGCLGELGSRDVQQLKSNLIERLKH